jgi:hypothetical protein
MKLGAKKTSNAQRPTPNVEVRPARFEVLKFKVRRDSYGSSRRVVELLNKKLKPNQALVYLKHNTLVNDTAYWTAIIENRGHLLVLNLRKSAKSADKKSGGSR